MARKNDKGKQPQRPRPRHTETKNDDDARSRQIRAAQLALATGRRRSAQSRARDGEEEGEDEDDGDGDGEEDEEDEEDGEDGDGEDGNDVGEYEDEFEPTADEFEDYNFKVEMRALREAQENTRQLELALAKSRAHNNALLRQQQLVSNATPGASGSSSGPRRALNDHHPPANVARPPNKATRPSAGATRLATQATRPSTDTARHTKAARPTKAASPSSDEDEPAHRTKSPPPLIGEGAPDWIPRPELATEMTMARIRFGLGMKDKGLWQAANDYARQGVTLANLDLRRKWNRQSHDRLSLLYPILEKRIPGLRNFEDSWATTRLIQTRFNHRRGHMLQREREAREEAAMLGQLADDAADLDNPDLERMESVEPDQPATDLYERKPERPKQKAACKPKPTPRPSFVVSTGAHADMLPATGTPPLPQSRIAPPNTGSAPAVPSKKARSGKSVTAPPPEPAADSEPEPAPKPAPLKKARGDKTAAAPRPKPVVPSEPESTPEPTTKAPAPPKTTAKSKGEGQGMGAGPAAPKTSATAASSVSSKSPAKSKSQSKSRATATVASERGSIPEVPTDHSPSNAASAQPHGEPPAEQQPKRRKRPAVKPVPPPSPARNATDPPASATAPSFNGSAPNDDEGSNTPPEPASAPAPILEPAPQPVASDPEPESPLARRRSHRSSTLAAIAASEQTAAAAAAAAAARKKRPAQAAKGRPSKSKKLEVTSSPLSEPMQPEEEDDGPHESDDGRRPNDDE
ncbi:hypothetical protein FRC07_002438 [Ceratobasidium sp. 392]|nr:hypothetical protein FRC07_002438 [Ceratobasidium sp. 392]